MNKLLICTDLDRTLIPNGPQAESPQARQRFSALVARAEVVLAYVSGRDRKLVGKAIKQHCLPMPDFVIGDVGTSIYHLEDATDWQRQNSWEEKIGRDWGGQNYQALMEVLHDLPALRAQEYHKQNDYKLSYYVPLSQDRQVLSAAIEQRLTAAKFKARLVWSVDEPAGIGLLDIIPASASKLHAIEELMRLQRFTTKNTVFCGDSGNDLEVLVSKIPAVLVGNSQPEVQQQALDMAATDGNSKQLYIARGDFLGMNGNYSAGMLEGIAFYYPDTVDWMEIEEAL